jgi:hypothetical protein
LRVRNTSLLKVVYQFGRDKGNPILDEANVLTHLLGRDLKSWQFTWCYNCFLRSQPVLQEATDTSRLLQNGRTIDDAKPAQAFIHPPSADQLIFACDVVPEFWSLCFFSGICNVLKGFSGKMLSLLRVLLAGTAIRDVTHSI